ncbi:hypothetical protein AVEN_127964-1 [Araneus ventricosus]|uniref:Uncharacterized protein n=1 Tax=Araneus ventricosus TaxID=182803 RepID=A0A4Y1ZYY9_ARAVE|nr:hypothetical protein AVEN_127964-1 [Araneus ventricosus]
MIISVPTSVSELLLQSFLTDRGRYGIEGIITSKPSPRSALSSGSTLNDRPPRLHKALWHPHNSPHYERLMRLHPGYDPSSEMSPKSHTTIAINHQDRENLRTYPAGSHP